MDDPLAIPDTPRRAAAPVPSAVTPIAGTASFAEFLSTINPNVLLLVAIAVMLLVIVVLFVCMRSKQAPILLPPHAYSYQPMQPPLPSGPSPTYSTSGAVPYGMPIDPTSSAAPYGSPQVAQPSPGPDAVQRTHERLRARRNSMSDSSSVASGHPGVWTQMSGRPNAAVAAWKTAHANGQT